MVSVVMGAYNADSYIKAAVDSILGQSFTDFEFIIINDGSTDKTGKILANYKDKRIRVISQDNQGLVASLNTGIKMASGKYIARQDADDISEPTRLEKQIDLLQSSNKLVVAGSSIKVMDMGGKIMHEHRVLLNNPELKQELLIRSPFAHGSVIMQKDAVTKAGGYLKSEWPAEDYGLWLRMAEFGNFANLDEPLYIYRENVAGISAVNTSFQHEKVSKLHNYAWQRSKLLLKPGRINLSRYKNLAHGQERINRILNTSSWIAKKSIRMKQPIIFTRTVKSISANAVTYRRLAGKIKRRIIK